MNPIRFNKERWEFGKQGEKIVLPLVQLVIGETLTPTEKFYDTMDAVSENYWIEIKCRRPNYHYTDKIILKEGWLIPACKIERAVRETAAGKKVCFYYYWTSDCTLWELEFKEETFADLEPSVPWWHAQKQSHYYVPQERWTLLEFPDLTPTFEQTSSPSSARVEVEKVVVA